MYVRAIRALGVLLCLCMVAASAAAGEPPDAAALHARGRAQLAQADFTGALASFRAAARAAPERKDYAQDALVLRRVVSMRKAVATDKVGPKWEPTAATLHRFYLSNGLAGEAVELDRRGLELLGTADAESRLAEALLEADDAPAVVKLFEAQPRWKRGARHTIFHGIALARLKRYADAEAVAKSLQLPPKVEPLLLRDAARLEGALGRESDCAALLVRCFEGTPPANLPALKKQVLGHADFARVVRGPHFARAMKTASKVKAAGCSGGADCGSCPKRGGCGKKN